jgi:hypothetical protein
LAYSKSTPNSISIKQRQRLAALLQKISNLPKTDFPIYYFGITLEKIELFT